MPTPPEVVNLGTELQLLADAAESMKGPMTPPALEVTSQASHDLANDASLGDPATVATPITDTFAHLELLFHAANDHLRGMGVLLSGPSPSWFAYAAVGRAVAETCSRLWYLTDPAADPTERGRRNLTEQVYETRQRLNQLKYAMSAMPPQLVKLAEQEANDTMDKIHLWCDQVGIGWKGDILGSEARARPTELLVDIYSATDPQYAPLAGYDYNVLSAIAHGLPSGVGAYHQPASAGSPHSHNVLTNEQVGQFVRVALFTFNAAFDRLATYFGWPHATMPPLQWSAIHAMNALLPP